MPHEESQYTVQPGWWEGQKGQYRARLRPGSVLLADPTLIGEHANKSLTHGLAGAGIGGGLGGAAGGIIAALAGGRHYVPKASLVSALLGAGLGSAVGSSVGHYKADKDFLASKGIKMRGLGLGTPDFTPEASEKYLSKKSSAPYTDIMYAAFADEMSKIAMEKDAISFAPVAAAGRKAMTAIGGAARAVKGSVQQAARTMTPGASEKYYRGLSTLEKPVVRSPLPISGKPTMKVHSKGGQFTQPLKAQAGSGGLFS
jgi:hypothetical protein